MRCSMSIVTESKKMLLQEVLRHLCKCIVLRDWLNLGSGGRLCTRTQSSTLLEWKVSVRSLFTEFTVLIKAFQAGFYKKFMMIFLELIVFLSH